MTDKEYIRHTGYPGGQRIVMANELMKKHPTRMVEYAVKGMLPKSRLGSAIFRNLYIYAGPDHQHEAQKPKLIDLKTIK
jgi:large subunit ribosomal protein L13